MKDYDVKGTAGAIGIDMESMWMLLDMFAESLDEAVSDIGRAVASGDFGGIYAHGHKLKGSSANLGFSDLAECCRRLESSAKTGADFDYAGAFKDLENEAEEIKAWHRRAER